MAFDLGAMLRRKGEFETARLDDFEWCQRTRTFRLFVERRTIAPMPIKMV